MSSRPLSLLAAIVLVASACSTSGPTAGPTGGGTFTVDYPAQGSIVGTSPVEVGGRAPAGARVVQDISLAADKDVVAGTTGQWTMLVELEEGANALAFRLADDESTEVRLGLTYTPGAGSTNGPTAPGATVVPTSLAPATVAPATVAPVTAAPATTAPTVAPPTLAPTAPPPTVAPTTPPSFRTFGDGTWEVGVDITGGTYRLREPAGFCYWARLKGFDGTLDDIIANENLSDAYGVVTIKSTDAGFESSGCDEWSSDLSRVTDSKSAIDYDGTYIVGTDITAGKWKSTGGSFCYWARLSAFTGSLASILANGLPSGPTIVTIRSTDKGFTTTGCGTWTRQ